MLISKFENPFYDEPDTAALTCCHIMEDTAPILYVSHDEDDGMWQFLCGKVHGTEDAKLVSLKWAFGLDNSIAVLRDMPCGCCTQILPAYGRVWDKNLSDVFGMG